LFDLLGSIEMKLKGALGGDTGKQGTTNFLKLTLDSRSPMGR